MAEPREQRKAAHPSPQAAADVAALGQLVVRSFIDGASLCRMILKLVPIRSAQVGQFLDAAAEISKRPDVDFSQFATAHSESFAYRQLAGPSAIAALREWVTGFAAFLSKYGRSDGDEFRVGAIASVFLHHLEGVPFEVADDDEARSFVVRAANQEIAKIHGPQSLNSPGSPIPVPVISSLTRDLDELDLEILQALRDAGAVSRERRRSASEVQRLIAGGSKGRAASGALKARLKRLVGLGRLAQDPNRGRLSGYWVDESRTRPSTSTESRTSVSG